MTPFPLCPFHLDVATVSNPNPCCLAVKMGRSPCCEKAHTNKGAWTKQEDDRLIAHIRAYGEGGWRSLPKAAGLLRCGKSCRLRWINYLRPDLKRGSFTEEEDELIIKLHSVVGNKWSLIAGRLPGRTDNEIKNYWNTHIKRKLLSKGIDPQTHRPLGQPYNTNNTDVSRAAPEHEIPASQNPRTPEIADFFRQDRSESSSIEPAVLDAEEHPDLNLNLCISLPSNSPPAGNGASSVDRTADSNSYSGRGLSTPEMLDVGDMMRKSMNIRYFDNLQAPEINVQQYQLLPHHSD